MIPEVYNMQDFVFSLPSHIHFGFASSKKIPDILKAKNVRKALIVVDYSLRQHYVPENVSRGLSALGIAFETYDEIKGEPTIQEVEAARQRFNRLKDFDAVIGIGGGSAMDAAKALAASVTFQDAIMDHLGTEKLSARGLTTVMVPSTAGTGAEVTPNAILRDRVKQSKESIVSKFLIPDVVVVDPEITLSLPAKPTAETGIDAFTHSIECFIGKKSNPMSDAFALEGIRLSFANLRKAVWDGSNTGARYNMALASLYGGIAIVNSGTGGVHALAYPLGGKFAVTHGLSNAVMLADVMEFSAMAAPAKFQRIAEATGLTAGDASQTEAVHAVLSEIRSLLKDVGITKPKIETTAETIEYLATSAMAYERLLVTNPRPINVDDAREIYRKALA